MRNITLFATFFAATFLFLSSTIYSQENKLERPSKTGVSEVDKFVDKSFNTYEESLDISKAVSFISVVDEGNGKCIKDAQGQPISKPDALTQLGELLVRAKNQNENIKAVQDLQKPATDAAKKASLQKKPAVTKNMKLGADALSKSVQETKKQIEEIDRQIEDIKSI